MKKLLILAFLPLLVVIGCKKDLTSLNSDPKRPEQAPAGPFLTGAQKQFVDLQTNADYNENVWRFIVQYWQQTIYVKESQYNLLDRQIATQVWNYYYRDVIRGLKEAKKLAVSDNLITVDVQKNQVAIAEIMEVYTWYYLVTTFGNVPYSEALDVTKPSPKYDDQAAIFNELLARLDASIGNLNTTTASYGTADIIYGGNVGKWKKLANTLKVKMAMAIADVDNNKAKSLVEVAVTSGVFTSNADNAKFQYLAAAPNNNPTYEFFFGSSARQEDFVAASTVVNKMNTLSDPRIDNFFTKDASGGYSGGNPGAPSDYTVLSRPAPEVYAAAYAPVILSYDELEFFLTEAKERGYNVPGTATEHYNNAVTASILAWGGTDAEATAYLAQSAVSYATAAGTYKEKIGVQKWIALYNRGWDAWFEWRRLDYPQLTKAAGAFSEIPKRFTYPTGEQNVNKTNYDAASSAIGGDVVTAKLFWDKF